jgi:osmotically-inducible protein OsmY
MQRSDLSATRLDGDLVRRIRNFLGNHVSRMRPIEIQACQGVVTIRGRVRSFYERQLLISCCQRVAGVVQLNDEVQVDSPHSSVVLPYRRPRVSIAC